MPKQWTVRLNLEVNEGADDPLGVIQGITQSYGGLESALERWVQIARDRGHSWKQIASALGVTRQSAWARYHALDD